MCHIRLQLKFSFLSSVYLIDICTPLLKKNTYEKRQIAEREIERERDIERVRERERKRERGLTGKKGKR